MKGALIGCGFFAQNQMQAWQAIDGVRITAICDRDPVRLADTAARFGVARTYADAGAMLAAEDLDFVDIATTVAAHRPLVEAAGQAGLHAICQKPFAETMADARAMVEAMDRAGRTLMVHENFRWQAPVRAAILALRGGAVGRPFFGRFSFRSGHDVFSGQPYLATDPRFIIQDLGIHILDIARAALGDATRLAASTARINPAIRGEDVATILLDHAGGATSVVDCSYATRRQPETFPQTLIEVEGSAGTLRLDAGYRLVIQRDGAAEEIRDVAPPLLPWATPPWHNIQHSVQVIQQHFVDCLRGGGTPETSGQDNLQTLALVEAAYASAAAGSRIALP
ncbi:Gfo/Idh/MocA family oxidoreductase [Paracoccus liaowanqingii]|uniref:Gfo/Idh/MocA family oxidoreductase n=1 Tax=Paracoccus liaowanqingii TaxID=2560053 RepID=A0A4Z1C7C4_9RHOB|nr:Gfo/Idh/MocA family oxidoreductase [Paracoccus liaowanqingii]TGN45309.1 Gfo/Idh/MocA family oxidoreductase [Paracoccus liaowanqingii]